MNEFERMASYGLQVNMIIYLMRIYPMNDGTGTNVLGIWNALSTIVEAIISDSYSGWFKAVVFGSIFTLIVSCAISQFQHVFVLQY